MAATRIVYCNALGETVEIPRRPERIVSFTSGLTEALWEMGCGDRIVGVSAYCHRYVPELDAPVLGDYLKCDEHALTEIQPDLILTTTGVQRSLARRLRAMGLPVYVFPLPSSVYGVWENVLLLGGLLDETEAARALCERWIRTMTDLPRNGSPARVYAELWFGPHARVPGGLTYVTDLIRWAGGCNVYGDRAETYMRLEPDAVPSMEPDVWLLFSEPEYPVDAETLREERGWSGSLPGMRLVQATVQPDRNIIHDGPSMMRAAAWLADELRGCKA